MLVADQAVLFKKKLFVRSCRAADFCSVWGAYEKDCEFFREYSNVVASRGKVGSLVLVARLDPKPLCQIILSFNGIRGHLRFRQCPRTSRHPAVGTGDFANAHEVGIRDFVVELRGRPTIHAKMLNFRESALGFGAWSSFGPRISSEAPLRLF